MTTFIAFTGVQGCGKTTTANLFYKRLDELTSKEMMRNITRTTIEKLGVDLKNLRSNKDALKAWQYYILKEHFSEIDRLRNSELDYVIMDRSYIDFIAYTDMYLDREFTKKYISMFENDIKAFRKDSLVFYLHPLNNKDELSDNVRDLTYYDEEQVFFNKYKDMANKIIKENSLNDRMAISRTLLNEYLINKHEGGVGIM